MSSLLWTWSTPYWVRAHSGNHFSLTSCSKIYFVTGPGTCPYINQHVYIKVSESFFIRTFFPFSCDVNTYPQKAGRVCPRLTTPDRFRWKPFLMMWLVSVLKGCTPESREGHSSVSDAAPSEKRRLRIATKVAGFTALPAWLLGSLRSLKGFS